MSRDQTKQQSKFVPRDRRPNPSPVERVRLSESGDWVGASADGRFVNYLPQDEAVAAGLGADEGGLDVIESQRVVDVLNRELSRLLRLKPREFWKEVAGDASLHEFLDSFLKFRSRWYDLPYRGSKGVVAGVIVGEQDLCRRVFMVLYRLSSNRDPGARAADSLSAKDHEVLLQEKKLLDLPKLLDICAVYGHENADLTRTLVSNAFEVQPWMYESLTDLISRLLNIIQTMQQRFHSSVEILFSSDSCEEAEFSRLLSDFLEVMDFINDAVSSMDALVTAYRPSTLVFSCPVETSYGNDELLGNLVKLHDSLLPLLRKAFNVILQSAEDGLKLKVAVSLKLLSARLVSLGFKLVNACYLSEDLLENDLYRPAVTKMFPAKVEDPVIRADIVIQTLKEMNSLSHQAEENQNPGTYLQTMQKNFNIVDALRELQQNGWICMDDEQFNYLSVITMSNVLASVGEQPETTMSVKNESMRVDEDSAILESKISQIRDLLPDYGKGFLAACLEVYDENPEEVIQRILEGNLHPDLQSLDPSMETTPKTAPVPVKSDKGKGKVLESVSTQNEPNIIDKGKGKMLESSSVEPAYVSDYVESQREGSLLSSSSSTGRFVRKSKNDVPGTDILDSRDEKDSARVNALISQYEYEDEYDDSFDEFGLGGVESGFEESEEMGEPMNLTVGKSRDAGTEVSSLADTAKWGSRKKPQYYVKDGRNYSYKVEGSTAVANINEAKLLNQAQSELIHGLGRGGNIPLGAVRKLAESQEQEKQPEDLEMMEGRSRGWNGGRGRGPRGRGGGRHADSHSDQANNVDAPKGDERGATDGRGRGRGGGGRGGRSNHYRKDRAMNKHFSGVSGF
ncbi:hypothetical protein MLD38_022354 [Melastoma candidum]|uniref:Uncharacterized protein n=1 Tax=Melastoma candidum TaxID=119954 RepID=A0ACB9QJ12_9MYRT|nr:hypothetical protein MLD38_022354 [Melastoma candidum]